MTPLLMVCRFAYATWKRTATAYSPLLESRQKGNKRARAVRFDDWKPLKNINKNTIELYRLETDEGEANNVASAYPDIVAKAVAYFDTRKVAVIPEWNYAMLTEVYWLSGIWLNKIKYNIINV